MNPINPQQEEALGELNESLDDFLYGCDTTHMLSLDIGDVENGGTFASEPRMQHDGEAVESSLFQPASQESAILELGLQQAHASGTMRQPQALRAFDNQFIRPETGSPSILQSGLLSRQTDTIKSLPWLPGGPFDPDAQVRPPPKIGKRFSSESVRVLKSWLGNNVHRPYPTAADVETIQRQTGLNKQQINTWLANARRRLKNQPGSARPPTPQVHSSPMAVPARNDTTATSSSFQDMGPLQRWQNSPPEHEPATASAIVQAVRGFPVADSPDRLYSGESDIGRSLNSSSSAGSTVASQSSSAYSHTSGFSFKSVERIRKAIKLKRRRIPTERPAASQNNHPFQCTFCTETFKTKWSWKRHEKSLHLSLEQWECTPSGPTALDEKSQQVCVYCGLVNPDSSHKQIHNFAACQGRALEERTFSRKDHLQQHLKLVHNSQFNKWPMDSWKRQCEKIRSRCGFCGMIIDFWSDRVDHVAEHFKAGQTMADWKGDWGFEAHMLDMVENSMAPYLIHYERKSPWPFTTRQGLPDAPPSAFELVKQELEYYHANHVHAKHHPPTHQALLYEGCCIIFGAEMLSQDAAIPGPSWLRDLFMSSEDVVTQARIRPMKSAAKSRMTNLRISGKDNIFEACPMEERLRAYVDIPKLVGLEVGDAELQHQAYLIVQAMEEVSPTASDVFHTFLTGLIFGSTHWLAPFRQRNGLPVVEATSTDDKATIPKGAGTTMYTDLLQGGSPDDAPWKNSDYITPEARPDNGIEWPTSFFLNDSNCYRRLGRELTRFVMSAMSPRNPNSHVPTDGELQHQARWIMFSDDDPWNQTPADNPQWLEEFKKDAGLASLESPSGLLGKRSE
ncbi:hypothetical protein FZEAL_9080 [Fusarium zealandicum]|uniref:Monocarboxylate transporter 4 n=1 Tax=Fusarium zealandicum TaxID=1053134 RepID=A0A8H4UCL8_9HYPO|nr:hypothetical protein FZEAL_9080 [Fusarium zealandicum]